MNTSDLTPTGRTTRREFLKTSGAAAGRRRAGRRPWLDRVTPLRTTPSRSPWSGAGVVAAAPPPRPCPPRGQPSSGPWRMSSSIVSRAAWPASAKQHEKQVETPPERQFIGLDGFKKAIDSLDKGDVVLLATPPAFRPIHFDYAVNKGVNVFMEKSFAVDAPGIRRVMRTGGLAKWKNLKVAGGLDEPALQAAGGGSRGDPRRADWRGHYLLGLPHARTGRPGRQTTRHERPGPPDRQLQLFHLAQRQLHCGLAHPQH